MTGTSMCRRGDRPATGRPRRGPLSRRPVRTYRLVVPVILAVLFLLQAVPCEARVTITVQFAYGTLIVGGFSLMVYFSQSYVLRHLASGEDTALFNIGDKPIRTGVPTPRFRGRHPDREDGVPSGYEYRLDLIRWRF